MGSNRIASFIAGTLNQSQQERKNLVYSYDVPYLHSISLYNLFLIQALYPQLVLPNKVSTSVGIR